MEGVTLDGEIIAVLIGGVFALCGTFLGAALNKRATLSTAHELANIERLKYTQDRIWDARKDCYNEVLSHLESAAQAAQRMNDGYNDGQMSAHAYDSSKARTRDSKATWESWRSCKTVVENNRLSISDDFFAEFDNLRDSISETLRDDHGLPPDVALSQSTCFSNAYPKLLSIAQREVSLVPQVRD